MGATVAQAAARFAFAVGDPVQRLDRLVPCAGGAFNGCTSKPVNFQLIPNFLEQPEFAVADRAVGRSHVARQNISCLVQLAWQKRMDAPK